jgi:hypothetical protein
MSQVRIDRVALKLTGFTESEGRRLGELVARGLGDADLGSLSELTVGRLEIAARASGNDDVPDISRRIVNEVLARFRRSL